MGAAQVRFVPTLAGQNHQRGGSQSLERMVRISSMNGPQSLELSVSITGIHTPRRTLKDCPRSKTIKEPIVFAASAPVSSDTCYTVTTRQGRYSEKQRELGRRQRSFWLIDEEAAAVGALLESLRSDD